jgi:hypothetical protein
MKALLVHESNYSLLAARNVGRRRLIAAACAASCILASVFPTARTATAAVVITCLFDGISVGAWAALSLVSTESFPTSLRASAGGRPGCHGPRGLSCGARSCGAACAPRQYLRDRELPGCAHSVASNPEGWMGLLCPAPA